MPQSWFAQQHEMGFVRVMRLNDSRMSQAMGMMQGDKRFFILSELAAKCFFGAKGLGLGPRCIV
jgi:hypothetical protein